MAVKKHACIKNEVIVPNDSSWTRTVKPSHTDEPVCIILYDRSLVNSENEIEDDAIVSSKLFNYKTNTY